MSRKVAARAIVVKDGKLFCVRLNHYTGSSKVPFDFWCTPGGGIDLGEELIPGLEREIIEELGIKPVIGDLLYIQQFQPQNDDPEQLEFFFHVTNTEDFVDIDLTKTTHGVEEIAEYGFVDVTDKTSSPVLPVFLQSQDLTSIKPSGNTAKIFSYLEENIDKRSIL